MFTPAGGKRPLPKETAVLLNTPPDFVKDAQARTKGALLALREECARLGAELVVAPIPSRSAVEPAYGRDVFGKQILGLTASSWSADKPVQFMVDACRELGIKVVDSRSTLKAAAAGGEKLYYDFDWHFNPDGNRAFSTFLHDELDSLGVFPAGHAATTEGAIPEGVAKAEGFKTRYAVFGILWVLLTIFYVLTYRDEPVWQPPLKIGVLLAFIFTLIFGGTALIAKLPPAVSGLAPVLIVGAILGFVVYKMGNRVATIVELMRAFVMRGHWYLMPVVVVLLTIGSLLVVAASSPLVAPFIYTLF